jgi:glycosyltransferase involved in cell wall biosynthesis
MSEPLVSVLTPVYNGEEFLDECIESVLRQTYERWEYVVVDNRSTDSTPDILARHAARDPRMRVVSPCDFVDQIANFNRAFRAMDPAARYCKMLCADDWLFPECLERMVAVAEAHPEVGLVGAFRLDDVWVNLDGVPVDRDVLPPRELCLRGLRGGPYLTGSPTSTMIRADIVRARNNFYDETLLSSDTDACYRISCDYDVAWIHQVLTYTRRHEGAETTFANRVHTYTVENLRELVRYGPRVMAPAEYRRRLRAGLARYTWFMAKQKVLGRTRAAGFRAFHLRNLPLLEDEAWGDPEVLATSRLCRRLLGGSAGEDRLADP